MRLKPAVIPMKLVGPIKIVGSVLQEELRVPLATFETPLWPSTTRGARISRMTTGIQVEILHDCMTRSIVLQAPNLDSVTKIVKDLENQKTAVAEVITTTSRFARLEDWNIRVVGNLLYIRFSIITGDASGHNMATKAADAALSWLLKKYPELKYVSISGNFCVDKKVSAVNSILGRGKYAIAEIVIPREVCKQHLRSLPEQIVNLHIKKNLIGSIIAGSLQSANAHFANILLAFYLATGQDAANIVEGSQGIVHAELQGEDLYFSVTLPNIIVGTVGNGKNLPFVRDNLALLGCNAENKTGVNAYRLAAIIAATVLCGELSLLAAQTNQGELVNSHIRLERIAQSKEVSYV